MKIMTVFITPHWKKTRSSLLILFAVVLMCLPVLAKAEAIGVSRSEADLTTAGQLTVNTRFKVQLPRALIEALQQGITLDFKLEFELDRPLIKAYSMKIGNWFDSTAQLNYKLSYRSLSKNYRLSIGGFSSNYSNLDSALRAVGAISGWLVLDAGKLNGVGAHDVAGRVRLALDLDNLPKPFQLNAMGSSDWTLSSGWNDLAIKDVAK